MNAEASSEVRQNLAIGRSVHYVSRGSADGVFPPTCRASVINEVQDANYGEASMTVFNPGGLFFTESLKHGKEPGQWHFYWECEDNE
jgi:hypothetical protein